MYWWCVSSIQHNNTRPIRHTHNKPCLTEKRLSCPATAQSAAAAAAKTHETSLSTTTNIYIYKHGSSSSSNNKKKRKKLLLLLLLLYTSSICAACTAASLLLCNAQRTCVVCVCKQINTYTYRHVHIMYYVHMYRQQQRLVGIILYMIIYDTSYIIRAKKGKSRKD